MDQAVGLRQEEIKVLRIGREEEKHRFRLKKWRLNGAACICVSRWLVLSDRCILPREDPGVLAQVQVQQGVRVLIAGAQSLRERNHS